MSSFNVDEMYVIKRDGNKEIVSFDKILQRIKNTGQECNVQINFTTLAMKVIDQLYDGISTTQLDELTAEQCASLASSHPDYNTLAGRILISNHQKNTTESFSQVMCQLYGYRDKHGNTSPLISDELYNLVLKYGEEFDELCDYSRDYLIDYFGFKTLDRAYLMKINGKTVERPQHMWLRVAIGIHVSTLKDDFDILRMHIRDTYECMSQKYFTHATPTLFNSGTPHPQLSSCFLLSLEHDSIDGIYNTLKDCAMISKWAGGIGLHIHNVRAKGSHIRGTNGSSNGIVPMLRVFNNTAKYVDQCVTPDTLIYTTRGLIPISQCVAGVTRICNVSIHDEYEVEDEDEEIVSRTILDAFLETMNGSQIKPNQKQKKHKGCETIQKVIEHAYDGPMLNIRTHLPVCRHLQITPEHPIYVVNASDPYTITNQLSCGLAEMEWVEADELRVGDWLVYSTLPEYVRDHACLTDKICYLYGTILRGMFGIDYRTNRDSCYDSICIFTSYPEQCLVSVFKLLDEQYIQYTYDPDTNIITVKWPTFLPFNHSDFVSNNNLSLTIGERWLYLPLEKTQLILDGFFMNNNNNNNNNNWLFSMGLHNDFISAMMLLHLRLGRLNECVHHSLSDTIIYYKSENVFLVPITSILKTEYKGILYDLQMKFDHNYVLESGIVHNGGGKRNGSFAIYLEPWHADIESFLQMRKNHGDEELKARDLFYALWIPDLFMERVKTDGDWTLMCPDECPGLSDVWGKDFVALYEKYEASGKGRCTMKARQLWFQILDAQMETGTPYLLYKDACNKKSNQRNLGTIKSSNLCSEIVQYSDDNESAVCNLASIALPAFIVNGTFDFAKLHQIARKVTYNLNCVIDVNYYPTPKTEVSNKRHRPIGIGIQGLADTFILLGYAFASDEARELNRLIFETIYHAALEESCSLAQINGAYETFPGSPASMGELQFDLWNVVPTEGRYDWADLKSNIQKHGLRNSLLLAPMPTASTSQILGYNECIEPITSNIYSRRTMAGEFIMANRYLMKDLIDLGLWNEKIKNNIIANNGSVQHIDVIPPEIREKYKTVWEIPMKVLIDMAADRGAFVCQSQSLNLWMEDPTYSSLTSMHFYAWSKGLKTGIYYLRRRGKCQAQQFTIEPEKAQGEEDDICEMCSS